MQVLFFYPDVEASFSSFFSDAFINRAGNAGHLSHCMKELKTAVSAKLLHSITLHFRKAAKMNIVEMKIEALKPYEKNPRRNDEAVKYVAKSIEQFGFKVPLVIDKNNVIVAGHTRYKAAKELGIDTVPCIIADDLTDEQIKAYRLADNKVSEKAMWDFEMLGAELDELVNFDMQDFGFVVEDMDIDWAGVEDLSDKNYEEPQKEMLQCPHCNHVDSKTHFMKVSG